MEYKNGLFIVLEGIDGSGTTTQMPFLTAAFEDKGYTVHCTAEPSQGAIGKDIRRRLAGPGSLDPVLMTLLFSADRVEHVQDTIVPHLRQGHVVLCDRYIWSTLAYQSVLSENPDWVSWVVETTFEAGELPVPDLTLLLDLSASEAMDRINLRGASKEVYERREGFLKEVGERYRALQVASKMSWRSERIHAQNTPKEVSGEIYLAVDKATGGVLSL